MRYETKYAYLFFDHIFQIVQKMQENQNISTVQMMKHVLLGKVV